SRASILERQLWTISTHFVRPALSAAWVPTMVSSSEGKSCMGAGVGDRESKDNPSFQNLSEFPQEKRLSAWAFHGTSPVNDLNDFGESIVVGQSVATRGEGSHVESNVGIGVDGFSVVEFWGRIGGGRASRQGHHHNRRGSGIVRDSGRRLEG